MFIYVKVLHSGTNLTTQHEACTKFRQSKVNNSILFTIIPVRSKISEYTSQFKSGFAMIKHALKCFHFGFHLEVPCTQQRKQQKLTKDQLQLD